MFIALFFTIMGFLFGLAWVMYKRRIRPGPILGAAFLGLFATAIFKVMLEAMRKYQRRRYF